MYNLCFWNVEPSGRIIVIMWCLNGNDLPEEEGCTRMYCPLGGYLFTPHADNPNKCTIELIIEADLRGLIPSYIQQKAISISANSLYALKQELPGYVKKHKKILEQGFIEQQNDLDKFA